MWSSLSILAKSNTGIWTSRFEGFDVDLVDFEKKEAGEIISNRDIKGREDSN